MLAVCVSDFDRLCFANVGGHHLLTRRKANLVYLCYAETFVELRLGLGLSLDSVTLPELEEKHRHGEKSHKADVVFSVILVMLGKC